MLKHAAAPLLAGLVLLAACGGNSDAPPPAPPAASVQTPPTPPTASAMTSAAPATSASAGPVASATPSDERDPEDKKLDPGRKPDDLIAFAGIKPGMKVAELFAGGGYTTEVLARAVGPTGVVYGQNSQAILDKFAAKPWAARLAKPVNKNVVNVTREFEDPLPPEAKDLDAVFIVLTYHDSVWLNVDRAKMNGNVKKALKTGGKYIIVDHSGRPGTGTTETKTLHRIDEKAVKDEVTKAGFKLDKQADFLRNKDDKRDWNDSPMAAGDKRGTSDRFVLMFTKP
jgi:predicted methyltransferase